MNLTSQTVLVTGATSGIGLTLAVKLYARNNTVIICGRRQDRLDALAAQYPGIDTYRCDVSDASQRQNLANWVIAKYPGLTMLVNNAGFMQLYDLTRMIDVTRVTAEVTTNLIAPIHLSSLLIHQLQQQPTAAILNVTSGLAFTPYATMPVYAATKAGLHSFTVSLRHQLKDTSVKVFEIIPPAVNTEFSSVGGYDNSNDNAMHVDDFTDEFIRVIEQDIYEVGIGDAEGLRQHRDALFRVINE